MEQADDLLRPFVDPGAMTRQALHSGSQHEQGSDFLMRWRLWALGGASVFFVMTMVSAQPAAPPSRGAVLFENRCARCHGLNGDGDTGLAPSLIGVFGRLAASRKDFLYSEALKRKGGIWDPDMLDKYLADPQAFAPGTDMDVNSADPAERAAIIEHIKTLR